MTVRATAATGLIIATAFGAGCDHRVREAAAEPSAAPARRPAPAPIRTAAAARQPGEFTEIVDPTRIPDERILSSAAIDEAPAIDGRGDDPVWIDAEPTTTLDRSSQRTITMRSTHTSDRLFLLVSYPDAAPSETHRTWEWDATEGIYKPGSDREDVLVVKWSLSGNDVSLSFAQAEPHRADIWFWKACRSNPAGHADDKHHLLTTDASDSAVVVASAGFGQLYLRRTGDEGRSTYAEHMPFEHVGDFASKYETREPAGSRADVQAVGRWRDGMWTIEFARPLDTGHDDDVTFEIGHSYLMAIACYEMAAGVVDEGWTQPLYRTGDAFDRILLSVE